MELVTAEQSCGNCTYWGGARSVTWSGKADVESSNARGKCLCRDCHNYGFDRPASGLLGCPKFEKWSVIK